MFKYIQFDAPNQVGRDRGEPTPGAETADECGPVEANPALPDRLETNPTLPGKTPVF